MTAKTEQELWSLSTAARKLQLSPRQFRKLVEEKNRGPQPKAKRDGVDLFDADELRTWIVGLFGSLRSGEGPQP